MVEMVLAARGIRLPLAAPAPAPPPARALAPVLRTPAQAAAAAQITSTPANPLLPSASSQQENSATMPAAKTKPLATENVPPKGTVGGQVQPTRAAAAKTHLLPRPSTSKTEAVKSSSAVSDVANGLNSISAAIASLGNLQNGKTLHSQSGNQQGRDPKQRMPPKNSVPAPLNSQTGESRSKASPASSVSAKDPDEWAEVLRYLQLFTAMQAGNAWEGVRQIAEKLRDEHLKALPSSVPEPTPHDDTTGKSTVMTALQEKKETITQQLCESQGELRLLQQQAESLQRETTQLRSKFVRDREAQVASQAKMEERSEALVATLQGDELRLEKAVRDVEELRGHVLRQGGLEQWQIDRVEHLRHDIAEARAAPAQHGAKSRDLRARIETASNTLGTSA